MAHTRWRRAILILALWGLALSLTQCSAGPAELLAEQPEVWHRPRGKSDYQVASSAKAGEQDRVWTENSGVGLLKWPDLWVKIYRTTDLQIDEVSPSGVGLHISLGTTLNGGTPKARQRVLKMGDYAEIRTSGTLLMAAYYPATGFTVVRVFDGQVQVRNLTGESHTETVLARQWALVVPEEAPQVSDRLEDMRQLARDLGMWDDWRQAEADVAQGFGPEGSRLGPENIDVIFGPQAETPPVPPPPGPTDTPAPPPPLSPPQVILRVDHECVLPAECAALSWDVENASQVYLDGQGVEAHGGRQVCPIQTTRYYLRAVGQGGETAREVTVRTTQVEFGGDRSTLTLGDCMTLRWDVDIAQAVYLDGQAQPLNGSAQVCPVDITTYNLRVVTDCGETNRQVTVLVIHGDEQGPDIANISVNPAGDPINGCGEITISCNVEDPSGVKDVRLSYIYIPSGGIGAVEEVPMERVDDRTYLYRLGRLDPGELRFNVLAWDALGNQTVAPKVLRQIVRCME